MNRNKNKREERGQSGFVSGVMILSLSTLLVKIIGLAFKIPILSFLGTEGMGYFNSAYEIYAILCVVATAGLPVALSMLVSSARARGDGEEVKKIFRRASLLFFLIGAAGTLAMVLFAKPLALFIGNPSAAQAIAAIAPALLFICLASAIRGYCQGFGSMTPTALSQLIEALCKLGFGILLAAYATGKGYPIPTVAAFAVLGITLGTVLSVIYLAAARSAEKYRAVSKAQSKDREGTLKRLVSIAFPITLGALVIGSTRIIDMMLIMRRLQDIGVSVADSNSIYGAYTTLAVPLFSLIPALITPVSMALVPELSAFRETGDTEGEHKVVENAMRLTTVLAMPASLGLSVFSSPVLTLLFGSQPEAVKISAPLLSVLCLSVVFSCLITTTNAILQSYRHVNLPIVSMAIGVIIKLAVSYWLIGNARVGAMGAPVGSLVCNIAVSAVNLYFMSRAARRLPDMKKVFFAPLGASALSIGGAVGIYGLMGDGAVSLVAAIGVAAVIYIAASLLLGSITSEDAALLPFGKKRINKNSNVENIGGENDGLRKEKDAFGEGELRR